MTTLSVLNWNIMHGRNRRSAIFPPRVGRGEIEENLRAIAHCIRSYDPDIVTLQEVDLGSVLSGSFDQFRLLETALGYPYMYGAPSCSIRFRGRDLFVSGNAIFSKYPLERCASKQFAVSFPTDRMGFVFADVVLPEGERVTVVSLHTVYLDWIRSQTRDHNLRMVEEVIAPKAHGLVVAGDYNCDLVGKEDALRLFVSRCALHVYAPGDRMLATHPSWDPTRRIDWILLSKELSYVSYQCLPEQLSDHCAVFARVAVGLGL